MDTPRRKMRRIAKSEKREPNAMPARNLKASAIVKLKLKAQKSPVQQRRQTASQAPKLGTHVLFLFIGAERTLVTFHSNLLPDSTKAYITAQNVGEPLYQLPNESVETFCIYRLFLYTGSVFSMTDADTERPDDGRRAVHSDAEWMRLAHCYLFALAVEDERFANAGIDALIEKMTISDRYPTGIASEVYAHTSKTDNLRTLLVDIHVWKGRGLWLKRPHDDAAAPIEFLQDVVNELAAAGGKIHEEEVTMPWDDMPCVFYHAHEATAPCGTVARS